MRCKLAAHIRTKFVLSHTHFQPNWVCLGESFPEVNESTSGDFFFFWFGECLRGKLFSVLVKRIFSDVSEFRFAMVRLSLIQKQIQYKISKKYLSPTIEIMIPNQFTK